jgi:hypothetical protein
MEKAPITTYQFVKARKDAPKMLELVDQSFNQLSLPVPPGVVFARQFRPFTLKLLPDKSFLGVLKSAYTES